ncbi:hypothetical protein [Xylocopilactobacillus apis]|uniref:Uncharacterized protein n=1 Tax=Xylocopilactobacillus apis TaxID=2932183 RepID=A0AAU9DIQ6_9LACO|nr:hypothetical protein [Xylocopilactobacillus apis]BDR56682.1 hypothetical protein KIMC2_12440 [Xylocopilactobacillus apis]
MAIKISNSLKELIKATNLGLSRDHPLAGWNILTILYHDGTSSIEPITIDFLIRKYNSQYLDSDDDETPITDGIMKHVLDVLTDQAKLVERMSRKIRQRMKNGNYHVSHSAIYRITSSGIEYLNMMQKVVDAENTITSNINQINEYCHLIDILTDLNTDTQTTKLYNYFVRMLNTYDSVMKGMHKLDADLDEIANDLNFNHGSDAAKHLQDMLNKKAIPSFRQLLDIAPKIQSLANSPKFSNRVAHSQQGTDDLDTAHAINDQHAMTQRFRQTQSYVQKQLTRIAKSLDPSTSAIDSSLDSVYLLFNTILKAIELLSREYQHIKGQSIDLKALTAKIDQLLIGYQNLKIESSIPIHLPQDRLIDDPTDLLEAASIGPVLYQANNRIKKIATEADNPAKANDPIDDLTPQKAFMEFKELVMKGHDHAIVDQNLDFQTKVARDEVIRLYSATKYDHYDSFSPFGRPIYSAEILPDTGPIRIHYTNEKFSVYLPHGFQINFEEGEMK